MLNSYIIWLEGFFVFTHVAILLGSIRVPYDELKRRILEVDEDNLTTAVIDQLIKYMPSSEQMSQLAALKDEYDQLTESEQFAVMVSES